MPMLNNIQYNISNPSQGIRLEKGTKGFQLGKKEITSVHRGHDFMCRKVFKIPQKNLHRKLQGTKSTFRYLSMHI